MKPSNTNFTFGFCCPVLFKCPMKLTVNISDPVINHRNTCHAFVPFSNWTCSFSALTEDRKWGWVPGRAAFSRWGLQLCPPSPPPSPPASLHPAAFHAPAVPLPPWPPFTGAVYSGEFIHNMTSFLSFICMIIFYNGYGVWVWSY